jgi:hypothetical protein
MKARMKSSPCQAGHHTTLDHCGTIPAASAKENARAAADHASVGNTKITGEASPLRESDAMRVLETGTAAVIPVWGAILAVRENRR